MPYATQQYRSITSCRRPSYADVLDVVACEGGSRGDLPKKQRTFLAQVPRTGIIVVLV